MTPAHFLFSGKQNSVLLCWLSGGTNRAQIHDVSRGLKQTAGRPEVCYTLAAQLLDRL